MAGKGKVVVVNATGSPLNDVCIYLHSGSFRIPFVQVADRMEGSSEVVTVSPSLDFTSNKGVDDNWTFRCRTGDTPHQPDSVHADFTDDDNAVFNPVVMLVLYVGSWSIVMPRSGASTNHKW